MFEWLKKKAQWLKDWWNNQKWVLLKWLFPLLDTVLVDEAEKFIQVNKQKIIASLNSISARENAKKFVAWLKKILESLLKCVKK